MANKHKRGEVWLIDLNPQNRADEISKQRPALIIQCDDLNAYMNNTTVLPFSTQIVEEAEPLRINYTLDFLKQNSDLIITQSKTISNTRLIKKIGIMSASEMSKISQYIQIVLCLK